MDVAAVVSTIVVGGTASSVLTELLKLNSIPVPAKKYPRVTAAILSLASGFVSMLIQGASFDTSNLGGLATSVAGAFIVSALMYNQALRGLKTNADETV